VFALLIYVKQLQWKFTAEVVVVVGIVAFRTTYKVFYGVVIAALYVVSIALIVIMDNVYNIDG
jgi:cell division protein FtsL